MTPERDPEGDEAAEIPRTDILMITSWRDSGQFRARLRQTVEGRESVMAAADPEEVLEAVRRWFSVLGNG